MHKLFKNFTLAVFAAACITLIATPSYATVTTLTFEGLQNLEFVGNFYNGGTGGNGSGPGPNFGVTFSNNAQAIIDSDAGGTGNIGGEPSPSTVLFFLGGGSTFMNFAAGFDTGFSFFYSAINQPGFVDVFDGVSGTGVLLAHLVLPLTPFNGAPDPTGQFSPFVPIGVAFAGTARSVAFGGVANQIAFDNITFGSEVPTGVPEPATIALLGLGSLALAFVRNRIR